LGSVEEYGKCERMLSVDEELGGEEWEIRRREEM
jgi:hypothetical protein